MFLNWKFYWELFWFVMLALLLILALGIVNKFDAVPMKISGGAMEYRPASVEQMDYLQARGYKCHRIGGAYVCR